MRTLALFFQCIRFSFCITFRTLPEVKQESTVSLDANEYWDGLECFTCSIKMNTIHLSRRRLAL